MDRMPPSEGGGAGSIPAGSTKDANIPPARDFVLWCETRLLRLKHLSDLGLAAGSCCLLEEAALLGLVYRLVGCSERCGVALGGRTGSLKSAPESVFAGVVYHLAAEALAMCLLCGLGNCHGEIVLYIYMIGKLTGRFGGIAGEGVALVEVAGVGYAVRIPTTLLAQMQAATNEVSLFIHTAVREDAIDLYGFATGDDLAFFRQLTSVSGIGPKSALGILNVADASTLKRSIAQGDSSILTKVFGIGKKSAERIVVELRDKLAEQAAARGEAAGGSGEGEVIEALMALGYSASESRQAVKASAAQGGDVRERLAAALKYLGSHSA